MVEEELNTIFILFGIQVGPVGLITAPDITYINCAVISGLQLNVAFNLT